jgi:dTDP-4-amino-4,6-dideoxygalactose transaminase
MPEGVEPIPIARPYMDEGEAQAASRAILSGWVTQGPEVAAFENEFAEYVATPHACAVSSCTTALHLALKAVEVQPGDEVITASHSFIATANSVRYCGAIPVFADIQPDTYNLDPDLIEPLIGPRTRAILIVHQIGMPCDMARMLMLARRHGLPVVEDAACAIGSEINVGDGWQKIGMPHGDIACFSFHPRKLLSTGDGGMLTTANPDWDHQFRLWRQHGMSVSDTARHSSRDVVFEAYEELGYNYRMTDIQAAIGRVQLKRLPGFLARRRAQADHYRELLKDIPGLVLPAEPSYTRSNWQSYCVRLPERCDQREVMQTMLDAGVATRRGVMCAHREPAFADPESWSCGRKGDSCDCQPGSCLRLHHSEQAQDKAIILPLFHDMTVNQQERVCASLRRACAA